MFGRCESVRASRVCSAKCSGAVCSCVSLQPGDGGRGDDCARAAQVRALRRPGAWRRARRRERERRRDKNDAEGERAQGERAKGRAGRNSTAPSVSCTASRATDEWPSWPPLTRRVEMTSREGDLALPTPALASVASMVTDAHPPRGAPRHHPCFRGPRGPNGERSPCTRCAPRARSASLSPGRKGERAKGRKVTRRPPVPRRPSHAATASFLLSRRGEAPRDAAALRRWRPA